MTPLRSPRFRDFALALRALFAVVAAIALFAYAISAWQVYGFARHVWELPPPLSVGAAVVADLLSLSGLFATYLLRFAHLRVRAYAWGVFLLMTALSILAAESFAGWRRLTDAEKRAYTHIDAQFAAGAVVVALALATHLLIVCVRHATDGHSAPTAATAEPTRAEPAPVKTTPADEHATPEPDAPTPPRSRRARAGRQVRGRRGLADQVKAEAVRRVLAGESAAAVARSIGQDARNVQNWVKKAKENGGLSALAEPDPPIINGAVPQLNVQEVSIDG